MDHELLPKSAEYFLSLFLSTFIKKLFNLFDYFH